MSLRLKTILGIALIEAIALAFLVTTMLSIMKDTNENSVNTFASTTGQLFASTVKDAVLSYDLASLDSFTQELVQNPNIIYVIVEDADSNVFSQAGPETFLTGTRQIDQSYQLSTDGVFDKIAPIQEGGDLFGNVKIGISIAGILAATEEAQDKALGIAIAEMIIVAIFSLLLGHYLTSKFKVMIKASEKIGSGDFNVAIKSDTNDEIGAVTNAFDTMAENLREIRAKRDQYQKEIEEINQSLEERVEKRTHELVEKNHRLEEASLKIQQAQEQLLQSKKMASLGNLSAGVAHEINNPVGFIKGNIEALDEYIELFTKLLDQSKEICEAENDESRAEHIERLKKTMLAEDVDFVKEDSSELVEQTLDGIQRVVGIVNGLKEFAREANDEFRDVDLNEMAEKSLMVAKPSFKYDVHIATDLQATELIEGNSSKLSQVLINLVVNAVQAIGDSGAEKGRVVVHTSSDSQFAYMKVQDNGSGIPEDIIDKLFDPFFTTKPVGEGTGLGLSIVHGIIQDHGGTIDVKSQPGNGTTFTVTLPLKSSDSEQKTA